MDFTAFIVSSTCGASESKSKSSKSTIADSLTPIMFAKSVLDTPRSRMAEYGANFAD